MQPHAHTSTVHTFMSCSSLFHTCDSQVQHAWSYAALCHDLLDLRLNRVTTHEAPNDGGPKRPKTYDLNATDAFWTEHMGAAFQSVASDVDKELGEYRTGDTPQGPHPLGDPTRTFRLPAARRVPHSDGGDQLGQGGRERLAGVAGALAALLLPLALACSLSRSLLLVC